MRMILSVLIGVTGVVAVALAPGPWSVVVVVVSQVAAFELGRLVERLPRRRSWRD
jgi:hypothetical protein